MYVDDILIIGSSPTILHNLISKLHDKFALKKLCMPQYFLGIEVHYQENGLMVLTQTKYINDLLTKFNMDEANGVSRRMVKINYQILYFTGPQSKHCNI